MSPDLLVFVSRMRQIIHCNGRCNILLFIRIAKKSGHKKFHFDLNVCIQSPTVQLLFSRFLVPVSMIICNDIMAYMFGFFFGKTPLIKLSPKKTWEGFIGGGISTIFFSILLSSVLIKYDHFICPIEYDDAKGSLTMECIKNRVFQPSEYQLFKWMVRY